MGTAVRRRLAAGLCAAAALAACLPLAGGPSSQVAWTLATVRLARGGDVARGKKLHGDCEQCHGPAGNMDVPDVPDLGGQNPLYVYKQLADYKAGSRKHSIMNDAAASLSERDMADLAAFYAAQKPPKPPGTRAAAEIGVVQLASAGDGLRLIPACDACHGDRGAGNPGFYGMPSLQNQKSQDLNVQLTAFRSGERANDVYRTMREIAKRLTDAEIAALASYYSGAPVDRSVKK